MSNDNSNDKIKELQEENKKLRLELKIAREKVETHTDLVTKQFEETKRIFKILNETNSDLERARLKVEDANVAKSTFLANMSHELRTPLNSIIGFSDVLIDKHFGELNDVQEDYVHDILESGKQLLSLIEGILDLSKVESGKTELDLSQTNIKIVFEESISLISVKAKKHNIQVSTELEKIPEFVTIDAVKIKQVMYNLLSNSVKFTPDNGTIHVDTDVVDRHWLQVCVPDLFREEFFDTLDDNHHSYLRVTVRDSGIGIERELQKKVFHPFEQEDLEISRKYGGTGLGLSITKKFLELHKGNIWVESQDKQGCTFTFVIPLI